MPNPCIIWTPVRIRRRTEGGLSMNKIFAYFALLLVITITAAGNLNHQGFMSKGDIGYAEVSKVDAQDVLLVNDTHPLPEGYIPGELVNLYEQKRHFRLAASDIYLERTTFEAANQMFEQAEREDMNGFIITSGYRTAEKQAAVYAEQQDGTASKPGYSEHQTGFAFDVTAMRDEGGFEDTPQFKWLIQNCWDYGFILRYPEGKENITGIPYEPWHYRYVGVEIAKIIQQNNWTLEEYFEYTLGNEE